MEEGKQGERKIWIQGGIAAFVIMCFWTAGGWFMYTQVQYVNRGPYGDMFGMINSLFSGLALGGIIFTILLQRKELGLQREELKATRQEFVQQNATLKLQRLETTFFNLLEFQMKILDSLALDTEELGIPVTVQGSSVFDAAFRDLNVIWTDHKEEKEEISVDDWKPVLFRYWQRNEGVFSRYMRNLKCILDIVDELEKELRPGGNTPFDPDRNNYAKILKSQLSKAEVTWTFYYAYSEHALFNFIYKVAKYKICTDLDVKMVLEDIHWSDHVSWEMKSVVKYSPK